MSFLRKFRNRLLRLNHVLFSEKIENWSEQCHFWENLEGDYLVWTMLYFQRKWELKCAMSLSRKFRKRLLGLNHVVFSKETENSSAQCHFRQNLEIDYLLWKLLYFQTKVRTEVRHVIFREFTNRLLGLNHLVFSKKIENWSAQCHFRGNLEIDYLVWTMLHFQRKLRTEVRNVIFEEI